MASVIIIPNLQTWGKICYFWHLMISVGLPFRIRFSNQSIYLSSCACACLRIISQGTLLSLKMGLVDLVSQQMSPTAIITQVQTYSGCCCLIGFLDFELLCCLWKSLPLCLTSISFMHLCHRDILSACLHNHLLYYSKNGQREYKMHSDCGQG